MTVKEFKKTELFKKSKNIKYYDINGKDVSYKPELILDLLEVIGTSHNKNRIEIDLMYED